MHLNYYFIKLFWAESHW